MKFILICRVSHDHLIVYVDVFSFGEENRATQFKRKFVFDGNIADSETISQLELSSFNNVFGALKVKTDLKLIRIE